MKRKGCTLWGLTLAALALVLVCLVAFLGLNWQAGAQAFENRPLVLIHAPVNHDQVHVGDGVLVHATARADNGLRRIELWADGVFVDARDATGSPTMFIFAGSWVPTTEGTRTLVVRAISSDGTEGQATVSVDALPQEAADLGAESETAAPLPDDGTGAPSDGSGAPSDGVAPGGEGGEGGSGEEGAPGGGDGSGEEGAPGDGGSEEGGEPPAPEGEPPEDEPLWDFPLFEPLHMVPFRPGDPTGLRVEFLGLVTPAAYEQLHCYVGYADVAPLWYPDNDGDQSTDESFALAAVGAGGEAAWSLAGLSGESMPIFQWHRETALPINVSCVGIAGGGTDALELGMWEEEVAPELWTGATLTGGAAGPDGSFNIYYRITRFGLWESGEALETNFDMTAPTNVRLDHSNSALRWDYTPRPEEDSISGFRVYLNGSLQWVEPADARESSLPSEWLNPPCGTTYRFDVTAYRATQESLPGSTFLEQPSDDCNREVAITFVTLETFDLPGDGDAGDRTGDIGPAYGFFFANEQQVTFSGGHLGPGLDLPFGLSRNTNYNISDMAAHGWNFSGEPSLVVAVSDGGAFQFGFHIMDEDSGSCHDSHDPGCDDLICEGFSDIYEEEAVSDALDSHHEETLTSADGRCRLTVQWGPAAGSPVGSGLEGWEPAPWIRLEKMSVDEASGVVHLDIRNTGTAAWPGRDLNIELQSREGVSLGVYTWPGFALEAGQRVTLAHPDMVLSAPFDACVMIDPFNDVVEEYERGGGAWHIPICPTLPDLVIGEVEYMPAGDFGELHVTVANNSDATITNRTFALDAFLADGSPLVVGSSYPNISLGPRETVRLSIVGVGAGTYEQMRAGYSVVVNPGRAIAETNYDNNTFTLGPTVRVRIEPLEFYSGRAGENQLQCETEVYFRITLGHGTSRDAVDWAEMRYPHSGHLTYQVDHPICVGDRPGPWIPDGSYYFEIDIPSGENLYLHIDGWEIDDPGEDDNLGAIDLVFGPADNFGEGEYGWTWSVGGYNNDPEPNGGHNFRARWRIVIVTP